MLLSHAPTMKCAVLGWKATHEIDSVGVSATTWSLFGFVALELFGGAWFELLLFLVLALKPHGEAGV